MDVSPQQQRVAPGMTLWHTNHLAFHTKLYSLSSDAQCLWGSLLDASLEQEGEQTAAYPSVSALAYIWNISESAVQAALVELQHTGFITP